MRFDPEADAAMIRMIRWYESRKQWVNVKMHATGEVRAISPYAARKIASKFWLLGGVERGSQPVQP